MKQLKQVQSPLPISEPRYAHFAPSFPGDYWQKLDEARAYPTEFVEALTKAGFLAVLIPEEYDGSGLGVSAAGAILEEIHKSGCSGGACHAQMYTMGTVLRHGSESQKSRILAEDRLWGAASTGLWGHRADQWHRYQSNSHNGYSRRQ